MTEYFTGVVAGIIICLIAYCIAKHSKQSKQSDYKECAHSWERIGYVSDYNNMTTSVWQCEHCKTVTQFPESYDNLNLKKEN